MSWHCCALVLSDEPACLWEFKQKSEYHFIVLNHHFKLYLPSCVKQT
jgi:hypothetical protein